MSETTFKDLYNYIGEDLKPWCRHIITPLFLLFITVILLLLIVLVPFWLIFASPFLFLIWLTEDGFRIIGSWFVIEEEMEL